MGSSAYFFLVEASHSTGMGHLMEACNLADGLKKVTKAPIVFLVRGDATAQRYLKARHYRYQTLRRISASAVEKAIDSFSIPKERISLIADLYSPSLPLLKQLNKAIKRLMVVLDNSVHQRIPGQWVVNFSITQRKPYYNALSRTDNRYLIGPQYMPQDPEAHRTWKRRTTIRPACRTLLITEGGSDPKNLTYCIIQDMEKALWPLKIVVILGPFMDKAHVRMILALRKSLRNSYVFVKGATAQEMKTWMKKADIAITAAGNTLYEFGLFGTPCITVCHHEQHDRVASAFAKQNAVVNLGVGTDIPAGKISKTLQALLSSPAQRSRLSRNIKSISDGLGSQRIAAVLAGRS